MRGAVILVVVLVCVSTASAASSTFYLDLKAGQCAKLLTAKRYRVLSCSSATHQYEVYAVVHGGWGRAGTPRRAVALARAQRRCNAVFVKRFGGPIRVGYGWEAFWPDPGGEARKYADKIICSLIRFPGHPPMGAGTHFRQAVL